MHTILLTSRLDPGRYSSLLVKGTEAPAEGDMLELAKEEGVRPVVIPELGRELRLGDDLVAFFKLAKLIWRERPAIVHTHTAKAGTLGRLAVLVVNLGRGAQRLFGLRGSGPIKTVHTYHGHVFHGYFSPAKTRFFLAIERALARLTDAVVVISPRQRQDIVHTYRIADEERVQTIPLGLDLRRFLSCRSQRGKLRNELGLDEGARLMGIVGRLVPIKRHDVLFRALSLLKTSPLAGGDFCCVVVGDGELREALERQAKELGLSEHVRFLGWRRDLDAIYADLDCLVLSSDNEGTPVSVIEALAAGVPVVATAVGGVPDLIRPFMGGPQVEPAVLSNGERLEFWRGGDQAGAAGGPYLASTGILVSPGNARALALALELLWIRPDLLAGCGRSGASWVHEAFAIERLVLDIDALYQQLLGKEVCRRDKETAGEEAA